MNDFIKFAAENWENESEYDGRMEVWCFFCGEYQGEDRRENNHKEDCLHIRALQYLKGEV